MLSPDLAAWWLRSCDAVRGIGGWRESGDVGDRTLDGGDRFRKSLAPSASPSLPVHLHCRTWPALRHLCDCIERWISVSSFFSLSL